MAKTLNQINAMPQVSAAFSGWNSLITIVRITQTIVDGFPVDTENFIYFKGVIQPFSPRQLMLKPEGERAWTWLQIHCVAGKDNIEPNDKILYNGQRYKVMANNDYSLNGYTEYHAVLDFQGN